MHYEEMSVRVQPSAPWYDDSVRVARADKRHSERAWAKVKPDSTLGAFRASCLKYNATIKSSKRNYDINKTMEANTSGMFRLVKELTTITTPSLPTRDDDMSAIHILMW